MSQTASLSESVGKIIGFCLSFTIFSIVLFFVLSKFGVAHGTASIPWILGFVLLVSFFGYSLDGWLK